MRDSLRFRRFRRGILPAGLLLSILLSSAARPAEPQAPAPGPSPTILLVGDLQKTGFLERLLLREQNTRERGLVLRALGSEKASLVVLLGDIVAKGGREKDWLEFDRNAAALRSSGMPLLPVLGNHEYRGDRRTMFDAVAGRFPLFDRRTWTVFRTGGLAVIALNSNFEALGPGPAGEQDAWYQKEIRRLDVDPDVAAIVVVCHHPPFTNSRIVSPSEEVRKRFLPPFVAAKKTALFVSAHCHSYEHFVHQGRNFLVTGGGGGPRQSVRTDPKKREFEDHFQGPSIRPFHYCRVRLENGRLIVQMVRLDAPGETWSVGDEFAIKPGVR